MTDALWITDEQLIERLGVPAKVARDAIQELDAFEGRRSGFPQKQKQWGGRRYWPAVRQWFDEANRLKLGAFTQRERSHG